MISDGNTSSWFYNGFGHLTQSNAQDQEQFTRDAFGNALTHTIPTRLDGSATPVAVSFDNRFATQGTAAPAGGRIVTSEQTWPGTDPVDWEQYNDESAYGYDASGNLTWRTHERHETYVASDTTELLSSEFQRAASYYAGDGRLAVHQVTRDTAAYSGGYYDSGSWGVYEEYWYDALGRRVLKRSRQDSPLCTISSRCATSTITRFVWDGHQILWEVRQSESAGLDVKDPTGSGMSGQTGNIGYVHAGGLDAPIGMIRNGNPLILHRDLRGLYFDVHDADGNHTFNVSLPGNTWSAQGEDFDLRDTQHWAGSLVMGQKDRTGLTYRRNRYYHPRSGQFTQDDPIGIAGGLNLYGFAAGDPVNNSDPFGLCPKPGWAGDCHEIPGVTNSGNPCDRGAEAQGIEGCGPYDYEPGRHRTGAGSSQVDDGPARGGGSTAGSPQARLYAPDRWKRCDQDMAQLSVTAVINLSGVGILRSTLLLAQASRPLVQPVGMQFLRSFAAAPAVAGAQYGLSYGSGSSAPASWVPIGKVAYEVARVLPYSSVAIEGWEALTSCTSAMMGG